MRGLILSCSLHRTSKHTRELLEYWIELARNERRYDLYRSSIEHTYRPQTVARYRPLFPLLLCLLSRPRHPERVERVLEGLFDFDNRSILPRISRQAFVIGGEDDRVVPAEVQREMAALIPESRLILCPAYGHGNDRRTPTTPGRWICSRVIYRTQTENRRKFVAKLDGKVAVITGASSGIGEATAEALAAKGASVVVAARREDRLSDLVGRINGKNGGKAISVKCDVTDEEQAHALIRRARDELGRVDILVNNAGVMQLSKIEKGLSDEWRTMFDVNASFT